MILACLTGEDLAAQLTAQAALFMKGSQPQALRRGNSGRLGSLRERIDRLYLRERTPSASRSAMRSLSVSRDASFHQAGRIPKTSKLVPFWEAVQHPAFSSIAE